MANTVSMISILGGMHPLIGITTSLMNYCSAIHPRLAVCIGFMIMKCFGRLLRSSLRNISALQIGVIVILNMRYSRDWI